jgi:aarF domain-containing kinase
MFGSPVNRIRITGDWASRSLVTDPTLPASRRAREFAGYLGFLIVTYTMDLVFRFTRLRQWISLKLGRTSSNFEDELERTMRGIAKSNFGVEIPPAAFEG